MNGERCVPLMYFLLLASPFSDQFRVVHAVTSQSDEGGVLYEKIRGLPYVCFVMKRCEEDQKPKRAESYAQ